ncbi:MAG: hypothetical protein IKR69_04905 [Bacteroidales bacterium]|nr:hypothetical protein [Bacteroidales bacterium]
MMKTLKLKTQKEYKAPFARIHSLDWEWCICASVGALQPIEEEDAGIDLWISE